MAKYTAFGSFTIGIKDSNRDNNENSNKLIISSRVDLWIKTSIESPLISSWN